MAKKRITVFQYGCERCNHEWIPRGKMQPKICPKCKSPYWDRPRKARYDIEDAKAATDGYVQKAKGIE